MGKWDTSIFNSIRLKLILGLIAVVLPILAFLIYNNLYSIQLVRSQVASSNSNLLQLYMGLIDKDLESIDTFLFVFAANDTGLTRLERPAAEEPDLYQLARYQLFRELYGQTASYSMLDYFFVYSMENKDIILTPNSNVVTGGSTSIVSEELTKLLEDPDRMRGYPFDRWSTVRINGKSYLIHIIKSGSVYIGALANDQRVTRPLDLLDLGANGRSLLVDAEYIPLQDAPFDREQGIDLRYDPGGYRISGNDEKYLIIGQESSMGDFHLLAVLPDRNILEKLPYTQRIIVVVVSGTVLILAGALFLLRRILLLPISRMLAAMRKIRDGQLDTRIKPMPTSSEFQLMNETFNNMASEIQTLKIDIYEEQLLSQKAELKQLQLQINPHFYLNSLNTFYYLAEDGNTKLIREMALTLIKYFRFMFRSSHSDFVPLASELDHTGNYLRIQEFRFPGHLTYGFDADDALSDCLVPPLILQTFAENAVKYAVTLDHPVHIQIAVRQDEALPEDRIRMQIRDNGKGFDSEVLQQIEGGRNMMNETGEHIGIWNVRRRLQLLYEGKAKIGFYNEGGAVVVMSLPLRRG